MTGTVSLTFCLSSTHYGLWPVRQGLSAGGGGWRKGFQEGQGCQVCEESSRVSRRQESQKQMFEAGACVPP